MSLQSETRRLEVLRSYVVVGSDSEPEFEKVAGLAAKLFAAPIALISLVDEHRQWFKTHIGIDRQETARAISICSHTIESDDVMVVADLAADPRFAANPLVTGDPHMAFYAGAPLIAEQGARIGTICVIDRTARPDLSQHDRATLVSLADIVLLLLQKRRDEIGHFDRKRERLNRSLFENNPIPMWVTDRATLRFLDVNEAAIRHYGWSRDAFLSMTLLDIRAPEERPGFLKVAAGSLHPSMNGRIWPHRCADGREILIRGSTHAVIHEGHDARMSVILDVTDLETIRREQAESNDRLAMLAARLDRRRQELADVQRLARLGSWRQIAGQNAVRWSDEMFALMGRSETHFKPSVQTVMACIHPDDRELARSTFRTVLQTGVIAIETIRITRPDGEVLHLRWDARQLLDAAGAVIGVYGYCQDITDMKRAQEALQRSEKLKVLGELTGGIAHDFNNLLTVVSLNLEEVQHGLPPSDPLHPLVRSALHAVGRSTELTAQLLSYARRSVLRPKAINLAGALMVLRPLLTRTLGKRHRLELALGNDDGELLIDPGQLDNALMNLVINARDAMPAGGTIQIETSVALLGHAPEAVNFPPPDELRPGRYVVISVVDDGTGIPPEILARVFEPFFTTKDSGQGSGLGLSMVFGFTKQSGGHIVVENRPGGGTAVRMFLPCHEMPESAAVPATTPSWSARGLRVLLVEDQATVLEAAARVLEGVGFDVTTASTAEEACDALRSDEAYDLLFTDINLQGPVNGLRIAATARELAPAMRILITTGYTQHSVDTLDGHLLGAEFLMKPYKRAQLHETLRSLFPTERTRAG